MTWEVKCDESPVKGKMIQFITQQPGKVPETHYEITWKEGTQITRETVTGSFDEAFDRMLDVIRFGVK